MTRSNEEVPDKTPITTLSIKREEFLACENALLKARTEFKKSLVNVEQAYLAYIESVRKECEHLTKRAL